MQVTVTTETSISYRYDELGEDAQERAREWYTTDLDFLGAEDWHNSLKGFCDFFPASIADYFISPWQHSYVKIDATADDDINELSGVRLWKWLHNNGYFTPKTLGGDCPFTGYCGDEDLLDPIRAFRDKPTEGTTLSDLLQDCGDSWLKAYAADWEYSYSDECVAETIIANGYEFDEDGTMV
jgi:hypothetical protein